MYCMEVFLYRVVRMKISLGGLTSVFMSMYLCTCGPYALLVAYESSLALRYLYIDGSPYGHRFWMGRVKTRLHFQLIKGFLRSVRYQNPWGAHPSYSSQALISRELNQLKSVVYLSLLRWMAGGLASRLLCMIAHVPPPEVLPFPSLSPIRQVFKYQAKWNTGQSISNHGAIIKIPLIPV